MPAMPQGFEPAVHDTSVDIKITPADIEGSNPQLKAADISIDFIFDSDYDGVPDDRDLCPNTTPGVEVDANGCSRTQVDHHGNPLPRQVELQLLSTNRGKNAQ